ncbi:nucleolar complex protein 2 homolog isoform X2 [Hydra vulgaris]|uniref:Nucleolar complex protein 2 homolog isoform X2 n=1 Tax=Hydra vulgaris TaxID=6087 RepID=A0ABM4C3V4_HYDVU
MSIKQTKKKIKNMSADEFMEQFDSDDSEEKSIKTESQNDFKKSNKECDLEVELKSHKSQLGRLKEKDPAFYEFLKENDEELLEFSDSDAEGELDDEQPDVEEVQDNNNEKETVAEHEGITVSSKKIQIWKKGLEKKSMKTLKRVLSAFHSAVEAMSPPDAEAVQVEKKKSKYVVNNSMFNSIVAMCLNYTVPILTKHLDYVKEKKSKKVLLPTTSKRWSTIKVTVKRYLVDILQVLRQLTDSNVLSVILHHCQLLCPYYSCFPKISKMFLKRLTRMWSSGEEHGRVLAFMCIRKITLLSPNLLEFVLKKMYLNFVRNSKFITPKTQPLIMFMRNSLVEMFALNENATYRHAFVYIRQLAIHLRNAVTMKEKDSIQSVYNWQFISCLQLWAQVVSELGGAGGSDTLKPLIYPVVQIIIGVIRLIPSSRYYPIRFKCIESLNLISEKTNLYIPTASFILEVLESEEFQKKPKSSEKPPDYNGVLKFSKTQLQTKGFQDITTDVAFESLFHYYVIYSNSIAFPELVFPIRQRVKRLLKKSKAPKLCKDMKVLIEKLQCHADEISRIRGKVTFSPKDIDDVRKWESDQSKKNNVLRQFYNNWKKMNENTIKDVGKYANGPEIKKKPASSLKRKNIADVKEPVKKKIKNKETANDEDVVEDFRFSDNDDGEDDE